MSENLEQTLEENPFETIQDFFSASGITYETYLDIVRSSLTRPTILFKRTMADIRTNTFNPWIANILKSNSDLQFILEEFSCAAYVVEYINKSNRGMSQLQRQLVDLQNEYPDQDYVELLKRIALKVLDSVEMSTQETAWYLLRQPMAHSSRDTAYITSVVPNDRQRTRKRRSQMEKDNLAPDSVDVWSINVIEKYEARSLELCNMCLA